MTRLMHLEGQSGLPTPKSTCSFWLTQPSQILDQHRTTPLLPVNADVVIVGSGIAGAFAARKIAALSPQASVVMLEAREACSGATGRNGGHCQPKYYSKPTHLARFELANFQYLAQLVKEEQIQCEWRQVTGCHAYMTEEMLASAVEGVQKLWEEDPALGSAVSYTRDPEELRDMRLGPYVVGAVREEMAASLWPYKLVAWVLERLLAGKPPSGSGSFNLQTNTPVTDLQHVDDSSWVVHTTRGMLSAKQVLLCTNAYTSYLLPEFTKLIVPVRGEMAALTPPTALRNEKAFEGKYSYAFLGNGSHTEQKDEYLIQRPLNHKGQGAGELMFGGGRRYAAGGGVGVSDDSKIDEPTKDFLRNALNDVLDLEDTTKPFKPSHEWSGIMGFSRDSAPWVGPVSSRLGGGDGLWICAGFTGHGMPNATLCAEAVVAQMVGVDGAVNLPQEYRISDSRAEAALKRPEINKLKINGAAGPINAEIFQV